MIHCNWGQGNSDGSTDVAWCNGWYVNHRYPNAPEIETPFTLDNENIYFQVKE